MLRGAEEAGSGTGTTAEGITEGMTGLASARIGAETAGPTAAEAVGDATVTTKGVEGVDATRGTKTRGATGTGTTIMDLERPQMIKEAQKKYKRFHLYPNEDQKKGHMMVVNCESCRVCGPSIYVQEEELMRKNI